MVAERPVTPEGVLQFYENSAAMAIRFAQQQSDAGNPFCLFNWGSVAKYQFYRALIGWRTRLIDPQPALRSALSASEAAAEFIATHAVDRERYLFDAIPGSCAGLLLDRPSNPVIAMACFVLSDPNQRGVTSDQKAMAWLISAISGGEAGAGPTLAARLAKTKRTSLWGETLVLYFELLSVPRDEPIIAWALTHQLVDLYGRRRRSAYMRGGVDYLGGEEPEFIIDGLLATIWHVRRWDPSGLTELGRLHSLPPPREQFGLPGPGFEPVD